MVNKLSTTNKTSSTYKYFRAIVLTGTTLLFLLQPGFSRNNEKVKATIKETLEQYDAKKYTIQETENTSDKTYVFQGAPNVMDGSNDALNYASDHVGTEYPDMVEHLNTLLSNFWNDDQRNAVDSLLNEHIMKNITDSKQRTAAIIYAIEKYAYLGSTTITRKFSQTHVKDISIDNAQFIIKGFGYGYIDRFNGYYTKLEQILQKLDQENKELDQENKELDQENKELNKEIKEINKQIEGIIGQFTINDVLTKPDVKKLVLKTEAFYIRQKESIPSHLEELANIAKQ